MCKFGSDCKHMFAELIDEHTSALTFVIASHFWGWLLNGCFGLNGPLRQYFSLYRAVSQREGERKEK